MPKKRQMKEKIANLIAEEGRTAGSLTFIFCSDEYLLNMNIEYLNHHWLTDVITFDYSRNTTVAGDIFISIDRVGDNATTFSAEFDTELNRVIFHGLLHLCGYSDKTSAEKELMREKENYYLNSL
ncbi:MAG: rRNA maturation RNase YbeY [Prevotellaceae bacterium]|nr:rRNA maturation RNase YbeY [Prevotellaceae bacterium]